MILTNKGEFQPPLPTGEYPCVIEAIEGPYIDPKFNKERLVMLLTTAATYQKEGQAKRWELARRIGASTGGKSTMRKFLIGMAGRSLPEEFFKQFETDTLIGRSFLVVVLREAGEDGTEYSNVTGFKPLPAGTPPVPRQPGWKVPEWVKDLCAKKVDPSNVTAMAAMFPTAQAPTAQVPATTAPAVADPFGGPPPAAGSPFGPPAEVM